MASLMATGTNWNTLGFARLCRIFGICATVAWALAATRTNSGVEVWVLNGNNRLVQIHYCKLPLAVSSFQGSDPGHLQTCWICDVWSWNHKSFLLVSRIQINTIILLCHLKWLILKLRFLGLLAWLLVTQKTNVLIHRGFLFQLILSYFWCLILKINLFDLQPC